MLRPSMVAISKGRSGFIFDCGGNEKDLSLFYAIYNIYLDVIKFITFN